MTRKRPLNYTRKGVFIVIRNYNISFLLDSLCFYCYLQKIAADNAERRNSLLETHTLGRKPVALVIEKLVCVYPCASLFCNTMMIYTMIVLHHK